MPRKVVRPRRAIEMRCRPKVHFDDASPATLGHQALTFAGILAPTTLKQKSTGMLGGFRGRNLTCTPWERKRAKSEMVGPVVLPVSDDPNSQIPLRLRPGCATLPQNRLANRCRELAHKGAQSEWREFRPRLRSPFAPFPRCEPAWNDRQKCTKTHLMRTVTTI